MEIDFTKYQNKKFAVAVSGGSDSLALLNLLVDNDFKNNITVLHFNHNIRQESAAEAQWMKNYCATLKVPCIVGLWEISSKEGNLQQAARNARYAFFKDICHQQNLEFVMVAHTRDDVAETFLMRLARGSGLRGLSSMQVETTALGIKVIRPLLHIDRESLKSFLAKKEVHYISDPSNENEKFFRVRIRKLKKKLHDSGLSYQNIRESALSLRRADNALEFYAENTFKKYALIIDKGLELNHNFLWEPKEIALRVLEKSILSITGEGLAPRTSKRLRALSFMKENKKRFTLGGVVFTLNNDSYLLEKE